MSDVLILSELLGRSISVEWHEAVAIVRGAAECLLGDPGQAHVVPELHQIEISPDGRIDVIGGTSTTEPVRRLGQLLQATLGQSDPPVQLRLLISQATAPSPLFGSIREYEQALGYFERPDRGAVLRALYARAAAAAPALSGPTSTPALDTIAPLSTPEQQESARIRAAAKRRFLRLAAGAGFLVIVCAAGVQYARVTGVTLRARDMLAIARGISNTVGASILSGLSAVTERAGLGRLVSKDAIDVESPAAGAASPATPSGVRQTAPSRSNAQRAPGRASAQTPPVQLNPQTAPFVAFDLEPVPAAPLSPPAVPVGVARSAAPRNEGSGEEREAKDDVTIYSTESVGVLPPVGVRPQLPTELPSNIKREDLLSIELIVLPDGRVDSVRLLAGPRHVHDVMWLSAVKAFEFRPALKDGLAVRYRKTVWITSQ